MIRRRLVPAAAAAALWLALPPAAAASAWVRVGGGVTDLAMGGIDGADLGWEDDVPGGFVFPAPSPAFTLDFAVGHDFGPALGLGFHWEHQWSDVTGRDGEMTGVLGLDANVFLARLQWRPVRRGGLRLGVLAGAGALVCDGTTRLVEGSFNFGRRHLSGSTAAAEAAVVGDATVGGRLRLQAWAGRRWARVDDVEAGDRPALREDGSPLVLDYGGWTARLGLVYRLGG